MNGQAICEMARACYVTFLTLRSYPVPWFFSGYMHYYP